MLLARLVAIAVHELVTDFRAEWARLDPPPPAPDGAGQACDLTGTTGALVERAASWDHDQRKPVTVVRHPFGFGPAS